MLVDFKLVGQLDQHAMDGLGIFRDSRAINMRIGLFELLAGFGLSHPSTCRDHHEIRAKLRPDQGFHDLLGNLQRMKGGDCGIVSAIPAFSSIACSQVATWLLVLSRRPAYFPENHCENVPSGMPMRRATSAFVQRLTRAISLTRSTSVHHSAMSSGVRLSSRAGVVEGRSRRRRSDLC